MKQSDLIAQIALGSAQSKTAVEAMLKTMADVVTTALNNDDEVTLPGLGKFSVKHKDARIGRNPKTGENVQIAAKKAPSFSVSITLKKALNP